MFQFTDIAWLIVAHHASFPTKLKIKKREEQESDYILEMVKVSKGNTARKGAPLNYCNTTNYITIKDDSLRHKTSAYIEPLNK